MRTLKAEPSAMPRRDIILFTLVGLGLAWVYFTLPPLGLYANDCGAKYIQMKSFVINHWHRLDIAYPGKAIGLDFSSLNPVRYLIVKKNLLFCSYDPLFTYLSSLFFPLLGDKVIYFLPLVTFFLSFIMMAKTLGLVMGRRWFYYLLLLIFFVGSPLLLHSIVFWEHLPATFLLITGLYFLTSYFKKEYSGYYLFMSAFVTALGIFFRTETLFFLIVYAGSVLWAFYRLDQLRKVWPFLVGMLLPVAAYICFNQLAYGNPLGLHASIHLPSDFSPKGIMRHVGILAGVCIFLRAIALSKDKDKEQFRLLCQLALVLWLVVLFTVLSESPVPRMFFSFPVFFVVFFDAGRRIENWLCSEPGLEGIIFSTIVGYISAIAIFMLNNPDLSERYLLGIVPLTLLVVGIGYGKEKKYWPLTAVLLILFAYSMKENIYQLKENILRYTYYNDERVAFLRQDTPQDAVVVFDENPLMEHCGPLYFERIYVVRQQDQEVAEILDTLKAKRVRRCYYWTMDISSLSKALTAYGVKFAQNKFVSKYGPEQYLVGIDLSR